MEILLPQQTIFYQLEKAIKQYRKLAQQRINEVSFPVSLNQVILLIQLEKYPQSTQVELSEAIFKDFASITRMVELLVKKGYLTRKESQLDRRKKDLKLTEKAISMLSELKPLITSYRQEATQGFSQDSLDTLTDLLKHLTNNCEEALSPETRNNK